MKMPDLLTLLVICKAMVVVSAVQTVHLGVLDQQTGPFTKQFMAYARDMYIDWLSTSQNNKIGGVDVDIILHRVDGKSDKDSLGSLAVDFMNGNWTRTFFTPENGYTDEPEQHSLDVMFVSWSSALIPFMLQGLKDAGIQKPVYAAGSSGTGAWFVDADMNGEARWDFAANPQTMSDLEMTEILKFLKNSGAKNIVIMEELEVGAWTEAVARGGRSAANELGLEIIADKKTVWPCKDPNPDNGCEEQNFEVMENSIGGDVKRGKRVISADVYLGAFYGYACSHELKWFQINNINFGAYAMMLCVADPVLREINQDRHKFILGPTGWNGSPQGENFDESYSTVQIYAEAGGASAAAYVDDFQSRYGSYPHYIDAWSFATFYYFHSDMLAVNADHTRLIERMKIKRSPIPSFYGLLGSGVGGINVFHKYLGTQVFPYDLQTPKVVAPAHLATDVGLYPCPTWHERKCYPNCVDCPFCQEIVEASPIVLTIILSPFAMFGIIILYWHFVLDFQPRNIWVDSSRMAFVLMNVASDIMAVLVMNAMMEEELLDVTDEYMTLLVLYVAFTCVSVWCSLIRLKWLATIISWNITNLKEGGLASISGVERKKSALVLDAKTKDNKVNASTIIACRQELAVTCLTCILCDMPIFLLQLIMVSYVLHQELAVSLPLVSSMIFSAITIGSVTNSTVEFSLYRMISILHGMDSDVSWLAAVMLIVNPLAKTKSDGTSNVAPQQS